jgi:hypothetical protein
MRRSRTALYIVVAVVLISAAVVGFYVVTQGGQKTTATEPIILYVNQGNGVVNGENFDSMASYAGSRGFNTVFFQVYRQGSPLFTSSQLSAFVNESHSDGLKIFFALYITNSSQALPTSVYGLNEDGISLDMSTLALSDQQTLLASLQGSYHGQTAVTTTNMTSSLKPNLLILETYDVSLRQYIRHGIVASVGVFATTSQQDYQSQLVYALQNSDGAMVFDYAGMLKAGY